MAIDSFTVSTDVNSFTVSTDVNGEQESVTLTPEQWDRALGGYRGGRALLTDGRPDDPFPIPAATEFGQGKYIDAPELAEVGRPLRSNLSEFSHLLPLEIHMLWKLKGGQSAGKPTLGKCVKASDLVGHYSEAHWIIWVAADHCREMSITRLQMEALIYHELSHAGQDDETMEPKTVGHDVEMFGAEVRMYGLWKDDLKLVAPAFEQARLALDVDGARA